MVRNEIRNILGIKTPAHAAFTSSSFGKSMFSKKQLNIVYWLPSMHVVLLSVCAHAHMHMSFFMPLVLQCVIYITSLMMMMIKARVNQHSMAELRLVSKEIERSDFNACFDFITKSVTIM